MCSPIRLCPFCGRFPLFPRHELERGRSRIGCERAVDDVLAHLGKGAWSVHGHSPPFIPAVQGQYWVLAVSPGPRGTATNRGDWGEIRGELSAGRSPPHCLLGTLKTGDSPLGGSP